MNSPVVPSSSPGEKPAVLAVIMARAGSVGLPNKSLRPLLGKPVITYTFDQVRASRRITRAVVSSDSPEILALARGHHFETIERPAELATATSATDPVLRHAVRTLFDGRNADAASASWPHAVVMLYGNIPLRANHMIDRAIDLLLDSDADSVQTIAPVGKFHPFWMFDRGDDGRIRKHVPNNVFRRQDLPALFAPTGAVYVMRTSVLMAAEDQADPHAFLGADRRGLVTDPEDSVDIDTEKDLYIAEALLRSRDRS
jgi:N-acylneuraminate cytidylyltransferase